MKNNDIQQLMERYRQGTLGDSGLAELNRLTHRDEVMDAAEHRATGIVRRRRAALATVAGLLIAGAATWTLLTPQRSEAPLVAEAVVPDVAAEPQVEQAVPDVVAPAPAAPAPARQVQRQRSAAMRPAIIVQTHKETLEEETVVVCNNQCEADSVISDIWKFLTV